jgi:hypothetical protein
LTSSLTLRSPRLRGLVGSALLALSVVSAPPALAGPRKSAPSRRNDASISDAAKARYTEGFNLYTKKRYAEARSALLQAATLERRPAYLLLLALASLKLKRYVDAARELRAYLEEVEDVPPKVKTLVSDAKAELREHLGRIRIEAPEGADVTVDGERVDASEPIEVTVGEHTVVVAYRGQKRSETLDAEANETVVVTPSFAPKPMVASDEPRARPAAPTPEENPNTPSLFTPPETVWPVYAAGVIGLGGLTTAIIFGGLSANANHAVDVTTETLTRNGQTRELCTQQSIDPSFNDTCGALRRNTTLADEHATVFQGAIIVGGAASAIALGWFFFAKKPSEADKTSTSPHVSPWASPEGAGATLRARF